MSKPGVDKSSERNFIKVILIKNQRRSKRNKKGMRIGKSRCIESDGTHCCTGKFNIALSLCGVLGVALYFFEDFSEAAAKASRPLEVTVVYFLEQEPNL